MNGVFALFGLQARHLAHIRRAMRLRLQASHFDPFGRGPVQCFRRSTPTKVSIPVTFLPTSPPLARALAERNYDQPTPVQTAVLAEAAADRDLLVSARTGSGKTVAYGLAIAKQLLQDA